MRIEKCGGDFCDYAMMEKKTGTKTILLFTNFIKYFILMS